MEILDTPLYFSNMVVCFSTVKIVIAIFNTTLNSKGSIASPCLGTLLTLNSQDKCLPILTLAYISLFEILPNLTIFWGGNLVYAFHSIFPFSLQCRMVLENQSVDDVLLYFACLSYLVYQYHISFFHFS